MSADTITSHHAVPHEWPQLMAMSSQAVAQTDPRTYETKLWPLGSVIKEFSKSTLDDNLFHALGLGICELVKRLHEPGVREDVTAAGTTQLIARSREEGGVQNALGTLTLLNEVFKPEVGEAYRRLPEEVQLIGNFLSVAGQQRRQERLDIELWYETKGLIRAQIESLPPRTESIEPAPPMLQHMREPIGVTMSVMLKKILDARATKGGVVTPVPRPQDRAYLRHPSIPRAATSLGGVHLDDLVESMGYLIVEDEGVSFWRSLPRRSEFRTKPGIARPKHSTADRSKAYYERDEALKCAALHVRGAIPLVLDMSVDMIDRASEILEQES